MAMAFIGAKHYRKGRREAIRLVVVHDMEAPEKATTAEAVARYFASGPVVASAHVCVDADSEVRCVADADTAFGAGGANEDGLHVEHAGYARQSKAEWLDAYGRAMLRRSARIVAGWCHTYDIPPVRLTVDQVRAGRRGLCGHVDVTNAYRRSTHTDPGGNFPWDWYLGLVRAELGKLRPATPAVRPRTVVVKTTVWAAMRAAGIVTTAVTVTAVLQANGIVDPGQVKPGTTITVAPTPPVSTPTKPTVAPKPKPKPPAFPGRASFRAGATNAHVTALGRQLVRRGYGRYYAVGPGPRWSDADRRAVRAFQLHHPALRGDADGHPGPLTWRLLFSTSKGR